MQFPHSQLLNLLEVEFTTLGQSLLGVSRVERCFLKRVFSSHYEALTPERGVCACTISPFCFKTFVWERLVESLELEFKKTPVLLKKKGDKRQKGELFLDLHWSRNVPSSQMSREDVSFLFLLV